MGKKNQNVNLDVPRAKTYICINEQCKKKWIFVFPKGGNDDSNPEGKQCAACDSVVQQDAVVNTATSEDTLTEAAAVPEVEWYQENKEACAKETTKKGRKNKKNKNAAQENRKANSTVPKAEIIRNNEDSNTHLEETSGKNNKMKSKNVTHSWKIFTVYQCTKEECGAIWESVHGWTEGFTQRCMKTKLDNNNIPIPCGSAGRFLRIRRRNLEEEKDKKGIFPYWKVERAGRHSSDFCDMCAKLKAHNKGICTNKKDVFITDRDGADETVDFALGPAPLPYPYELIP